MATELPSSHSRPPPRQYRDSAIVARASGEGRTLAASMPRLILEARRVAATVIHGLHGRRRAGPGENFWQYRRFVSGEPASRVDWRRSARDDHLYVREQEWEAAHTVWIWPDRSPSMHFASALARDSKLYRTLLIALALAEVVLLSDLWSEIADVRQIITQLSGRGTHGHVVQIVDPAEETFPYWGRIEFVEPEDGRRITAGRAESWRADYTAQIAQHRAAIRSETDRLGWSFSIHRTDRPASELLLALHARIGAGMADEWVQLRRPGIPMASA